MATSPSNINSTTFWSPQQGYGTAYQQGVGITSPDPNHPGQQITSPGNPYQFATGDAANYWAQQLGGSVQGDQLSGPGYGYVGADGKPITQNQIRMPDGTLINAGLVNNNFSNYGSSPGSYGQYQIAGGGAAPANESYAQYALSQPGFQMNPQLANSGPGYNYAWNPNTGTYTNTATGQTGITQAQAITQMQQANSPTASSPSLGTTSSPTAPTSSTATPSWVPKGFTLGPGGNLVPANVANPTNSTSVGDTRAPLPPPPPPQTSGTQAPVAGTPTSSAPNVTNGGLGFAPTGNAAEVAPNTQYQTTAGNGNPLSYLRYNDPTQGPFNGQYGQPTAQNPGAIPPYTGDHIDQMAQNNRNLAIGEGAGLSQELQNYTNFNAGQSADFQQQLASAYAPIAAGRGGYTNEQMASILNEPALQALQLTPEQAQSNFLTDSEQQGISGDPYAPYRQLGLDEQGIDAATGSRYGAVNDALAGQTGAINGALGNTASAIGGTLGEFNTNYNFGPQDEQAIREQAGRTVGNQELSDEDRLQLQANQQGNTSPLAIQAARDRMRQTGAVNEANAMSDAAIKAKQLALQTTATREATQQGAEQYLGYQQQQAQQYLGQSNVNNQQTLGAANQAAEEYKTGTNLGAGQTAEQTAATRAAQIASNRQTTNEGNQVQQYQRGQYIYGTNNATNTGFANQTLQQQQEYRNYLQNQQTQANQNQTIGNQQQIGVYGTQIGGANSATNGAIANYGTKPGDPTLPTSLLGVAKGGAFTGPQDALVGEAGPELILDFSGPEYGADHSAQNGGSRPVPKMASGGFAGLPGLPGLSPDPGDYSVYDSQPGGWQQATPVQQQQSNAAQQPNPGDLVSQGPTGAGAIRPKNNSLYNGIVSGLGSAQGAMSGPYGSAASGSGGNILSAALNAAKLYQLLKGPAAAAGTGTPIPGAGPSADSRGYAHGGVIRPMARGGTIAPVTMPPPQWPDVDSSVGGTTVNDGSLGVGGSQGSPSLGLPGPTAPPKSSTPPTPSTPPVIPPTPPLNGGMGHIYVPPPKEEAPSTITYPPTPKPPGEEAPSTITYPPAGETQFPPEPPEYPSDPGGIEGNQTHGYIPPPIGLGKTIHPPTIRSGGLTGLGESSSTFTPNPEDPTATPGEQPPLTPPTMPTGGLTGPGTSESTISFPPETATGAGSGPYAPDPRTPWTDPNAWIPGGYGGTPGVTPENPGTGAAPLGTSPTETTPPEGTVNSTFITDPNYQPPNYDPFLPPGVSPITGNSGGDPGTVAGGGGGGYYGGGEDEEDGYASGGIINSHHPYGAKGESRLGQMLSPKPAMPKVSLVDQPQLRTLGLHGPSAVIPLVKRAQNRLNVSDIPRLMHEFSGPSYGR